MVIMALDHVRDYFHITANLDNPLNLETTTPLIFITRWITHFCAPVFVFLSGTSIYLQSLRKTKRELSLFLMKRGLWLIAIEFVIISLGWSFNPQYHFIFLQVIWAIGISMFILGLLVHLPYSLLLSIGLLIVFGHNLLDGIEAAADFKAGFIWDLLHSGYFSVYSYFENHSVIIVYPFVPWLGVMILGYCFGIFYSSKYSAVQRKQLLLYMGIALILIFIVLRYLNFYGDPVKWSVQKSSLFSFFSFIDVNKYPPSLLFLCITIGPSLLFLVFIEKIKNRWTDFFQIYGRVAFFYYILHIYLIHLIATICFFARGHTLDEATITGQNFPFYFLIPGEGYTLEWVYLVWGFVVLALYPLCKWYNHYKSTNKEKWWLSYL